MQILNQISFIEYYCSTQFAIKYLSQHNRNLVIMEHCSGPLAHLGLHSLVRWKGSFSKVMLKYYVFTRGAFIFHEWIFLSQKVLL